jgi:mRNA interferase RelE/StbE
MFQITVSNKATRSAKRLPQHFKSRIMELLLTLRENPTPAENYDVKKLQGEKDTFRIRLGDIRVVYEIEWNEKIIKILVIEHRGKAYST